MLAITTSRCELEVFSRLRYRPGANRDLVKLLKNFLKGLLEDAFDDGLRVPERVRFPSGV